jgi:hypothetical protein
MIYNTKRQAASSRMQDVKYSAAAGSCSFHARELTCSCKDQIPEPAKDAAQSSSS